MSTTSPHQWTKSTYSNPDGGNCLEWDRAHAAAVGVAPVRDSKRPNGPIIYVSANAWAGLVGFVQADA
ncbi:DUF397 domain-containing protein [Streptomyces sp. NPDC002054]|uniref:DUF397 domain-containing protein n=1 Tax=Streptomyces sp. NPDC002054 TaxID=3154663 RepID=UPI00331A46B7